MRQLETFLQLSDTGSFGEAAIKLGIGQPGLSRNVRHMEDELGVTLIRRHSKGALLTRDGLTLKQLTAAFLEGLQGLSEPDAAVPGQGTVRLGLPEPLGPVLIPAILAAAGPQLAGTVDFVEAPDMTLEHALSAGALDLALLYDPPRTDLFEAVPLVREDLVLVTAPSWVAPGGPVGMRQLRTMPLVQLKATYKHQAALRALERKGAFRFKVAVEVDKAETLKSVVREGNSFAVLSALSVARERRAGSLQAVPLDGPAMHTTLTLARPRARPGSADLHGLPSVISAAVLAASRDQPGVTGAGTPRKH